MKNMRQKIVIICLILLSTFWLAYFGAEYLYNKQNTTYEISVQGNFTEIDQDFFLNALAKYDEAGNVVGYSYASVDIKTMFEKEDVEIIVDGSEITLRVLAKYFINSQGVLVTSESLERFIKVAKKVFTFYDKDAIISQPQINNNTSGIIWGMVGLGIGIIISGIYIIISRRYQKLDNERLYDQKETFAHPFSLLFWQKAFKSLQKMKVFDLCFIALLFALQMLCKLIVIPTGFANLGIGITYLVFSFICMIYGPFWGLVIGFFSDILGFFIFPNGAFFYFGYTLQAMLTGFVYGIFLYRARPSFARCMLARVVVNLLINALLGSILWGEVSDLSWSGVIDYMLFISLPKNIIFLIPQALLMYGFFKVLKPILRHRNLVPEVLLND